MKYTMIPRPVVEKICNLFQDHSYCVNEKYKEITKKPEYSCSDRDRFVARFFKPYVGKYIVLVNKDEIGRMMADGNIVAWNGDEPVSCYSRKAYKSKIYNGGKPWYSVNRKYLYVQRFENVNEAYGQGYICMSCQDILGNTFDVVLSHNNLQAMQFREITEEEFKAVADLFTDDREPVPFKVTRYLNYEEMKSRRLLTKYRKEKTLLTETVIVPALDVADACTKVENVNDVEPMEHNKEGC